MFGAVLNFTDKERAFGNRNLEAAIQSYGEDLRKSQSTRLGKSCKFQKNKEQESEEPNLTHVRSKHPRVLGPMEG